MQGKDPALEELGRTRQPFIWSELWCQYPHRFDPELVWQIQKHLLDHSLCGSTVETIDHQLECYVVLTMASQEECRLYLKYFTDLLSHLASAFHRSYPRSTLTEREHTVLQLRAYGHQVKAIAAWLNISPRTAKKHIEAIKEKLNTDDLVNAMVIATKLGMID